MRGGSELEKSWGVSEAGAAGRRRGGGGRVAVRVVGAFEGCGLKELQEQVHVAGLPDGRRFYHSRPRP